nr:replication enhancer protein [Tomato yellow leaf curl Thailand virus]
MDLRTGELLTATQLESGVYIWTVKNPPIFQDNQAPREPIPEEPRHNHVTNPVQPQPEESVGDTQMFSSLQNLDSFTSSDLAFLKSI